MTSSPDTVPAAAPAPAGGPVAAWADADPAAAAARLADATVPFLIGVRHHSPALSVVVAELLDGFRPEVLLLELPAEFAEIGRAHV